MAVDPDVGWGIGVASHLMVVRNEETKQAEIDREIGRIRQQRALPPEPDRD